MLGIIVVLMVISSTVYTILTNGSVFEFTNSIINSGNYALDLVFTLVSTMALWGGILRIAEDSGLTKLITKAVTPLFEKIYAGLKKDSKAIKAIAMNFTANVLGLGNAATPLGIEAMKRLEEEEKPGEKASRNMIMFAIFNTCSVQLIPTTVIALRTAHGSASPAKIIPCVIAVSVISLFVSALSVIVFESFKK